MGSRRCGWRMVRNLCQKANYPPRLTFTTTRAMRGTRPSIINGHRSANPSLFRARGLNRKSKLASRPSGASIARLSGSASAYATGSPLVLVDNKIDWQRPWSLLRAHVPCAVPGGRATYEIQFGWLERAAHSNTSWDAARHESPHQQWTDFSNAQKGVAILNDGKYGSLIKDGTMELSLMRCVPYPHADVKAAETTGDLVAAFSDLGAHHCRFALYPHLGDHTEAGVWRRAREFNLEPHVAAMDSEAAQPAASSLFNWTGTDADFDLPAFKISQARDGVVIRINRFANAEGVLKIAVLFPVKEVWETNLLEEPLGKLSLASGRIQLRFLPFEVKTLLFRTE